MQKSGGKEEWTVSPDLKCIEKICRIQQLWMLCNSTGRCIVTLQSVLCIVCVFLFFWHNSLTYIQNPLKSKSFWSSFLSSWSKPWKWLRLKHSSETEICLLNPEGFQWRCICSLGSFLHPAPNWNQPHKEDYTISKQQLQRDILRDGKVMPKCLTQLICLSNTPLRKLMEYFCRDQKWFLGWRNHSFMFGKLGTLLSRK